MESPDGTPWTKLMLYDGPTNMELDRRLLSEAENGACGWRVYGWAGPWISLGCFQSPDRDLLLPIETQWVMRPTGGKAVLHGHDVTIGLAVPLALIGDEGEMFRSIKAVYRAVVSPIVDALQRCGVPASLADRTQHSGQGLKTADCFTFTSPNDVVDETTGQKVCGCALKLTERAVLVQASIPAAAPLVDITSVVRGARPLPFQPWDSTHFEEAFQESMELLTGRTRSLTPK